MNESFKKWVAGFRNEFKYQGATGDAEETALRIERIINRINQPIPENWQRHNNQSQTGGTLGSRRSDKDRAKCESALEQRMFKHQHSAWKVGNSQDGLKLLPRINEQYLTNEKTGQVRVDAVGYLESSRSKVIAAIEIKDRSNHCWHAVVENIIQVLLLRGLPKTLTASHSEWQYFRDQDFAQTVGVILAPAEFYTARGQRSTRVRDAKELIQAVWSRTGLRIYLLSFRDEVPDEDMLDLVFEPDYKCEATST